MKGRTMPATKKTSTRKTKVGVSKSQAVRDLLTENLDMMPTEGVKLAKQRYGVKIAPGLFSNIKAKMKNGKSAPTPKATAKKTRSKHVAVPTTLFSEISVKLTPRQAAIVIRCLSDTLINGVK
jgi:hypothetical protein